MAGYIRHHFQRKSSNLPLITVCHQEGQSDPSDGYNRFCKGGVYSKEASSKQDIFYKLQCQLVHKPITHAVVKAIYIHLIRTH